MKIGRVTGSVTATVKDNSLEGVILLLVQPLDEDLNEKGAPLVACDTVQAGPGDLVIYEGGREAAMALKNHFNPSDAAVIGIIDQYRGEKK
jgi:ethanolamine utilization protein EutN